MILTTRSPNSGEQIDKREIGLRKNRRRRIRATTP
jgi:hypothetical protein